MAEPSDDEDQIFSGGALGEDGSVSRAKPAPQEVPAPPGARRPPAAPPSPVLEPVFEQDMVPKSHFQEAPPLELAPVELVERAPRPPSDFTPMPVPDRPRRPPSPDIHWFRWFLLLSVLAVVAGGVFIVTTARSTVDRLLAPGVLDRLLPPTPRPGETGKAKEPQPPGEKRVGTPAPSLLVLSDPSGATVLVGGAVVGKTPWAGDNVWPKGPLRIEVRKPGYRAWETTVEGGAGRTVEATLRRR
jgi:serine/threonine-protein kinase